MAAREYVARLAAFWAYRTFTGDLDFAQVCQTETATGTVDVMRI